MTDENLAVFRRIGFAIGFALLAGGFAIAIGGASSEASPLAALGGAIVGACITPFQKSRSEKKEVEKD